MSELAKGLIRDETGKCRCFWCGSDPFYQAYHDNEWGRPVTNDTRLFEKLCLEGFQSGLSWITILRKRENFRAAFAGFEIDRVAAFTEDDVARMLNDTGIVRHGGKIRSAINNAKRAQELIAEKGSLAAYFWNFEPKAHERPQLCDYETLIAMPKTEISTAISKDLKKRGWSFVGPTTVYAFMQAMGLVNDHIEGCHLRNEVEKERQAAKRPV
ncbi:DNA-3-methyladenine glycosylase I [Limoniibacter endophyticus]|uniref:DNA-3-methyladenine glycosylase I n=1 Tax=Limoniibacter endophyticus TaxID=1565040 RepID=A0A8J3GGU7_9HYPH|nr:DNA-3-methyladenine glycosylase I [Limoniibacter endophyticus]GHC67787.1 DNA-3-methyladenine glycosylase I [Limoniibacter endophyticus]